MKRKDIICGLVLLIQEYWNSHTGSEIPQKTLTILKHHLLVNLPSQFSQNSDKYAEVYKRKYHYKLQDYERGEK